MKRPLNTALTPLPRERSFQEAQIDIALTFPKPAGAAPTPFLLEGAQNHCTTHLAPLAPLDLLDSTGAPKMRSSHPEDAQFTIEDALFTIRPIPAETPAAAILLEDAQIACPPESPLAACTRGMPP